MKTQDVTVGTEIYNCGDCCNLDHFGVISKITDGCFGGNAIIQPIGDHADEVKPYSFPVRQIEHFCSGIGSTRVVTKAAYNAYMAERMKVWNEFAARMAKKEVKI